MYTHFLKDTLIHMWRDSCMYVYSTLRTQPIKYDVEPNKWILTLWKCTFSSISHICMHNFEDTIIPMWRVSHTYTLSEGWNISHLNSHSLATVCIYIYYSHMCIHTVLRTQSFPCDASLACVYTFWGIQSFTCEFTFTRDSVYLHILLLYVHTHILEDTIIPMSRASMYTLSEGWNYLYVNSHSHETVCMYIYYSYMYIHTVLRTQSFICDEPCVRTYFLRDGIIHMWIHIHSR